MTPPTSLQWLSLVGAIWLQTINGANSDFPAYSSQLKQLLSISQMQLNNLAFASDAGKLFGWFSGIAATYLPLWVLLMIGASLGLVGYGLQFLFLIDKISLSYWHVFVLSVLAGNGICWINTVCYLVSIQNFPSNHRVAVGLSTSYVGLSAKVYTVLAGAISNALPGQKAKAYLLLNALSPMLVSIMTSPFVGTMETTNHSTKTKPPSTDGGFMAMFVITTATGIIVILFSIGGASIEPPSKNQVVVIGLLLAAPLVVPAAIRLRKGLQGVKWNSSSRRKKVHDLAVDGSEIESTGGGEKELQVVVVIKECGVGGDEITEASTVVSREELGVWQMVGKMDFWLYFFAYMFGATVGLVFLNNLGQIGESRGLSKTSFLVSLSSSFGFFGRFMPFLLDYFFSKYMASRPAFMATLMAPMAGAFFLLLHPSNLCLYTSTAIIGACTGAITSVAVSTTPDLFGTKHFSENHNVIVANIPIGSFLFGYLAAFLYQKRGGGGGSGTCIGTKCYDISFIVWGCLCSVATLLCFILYMRTRRFFREAANKH